MKKPIGYLIIAGCWVAGIVLLCRCHAPAPEPEPVIYHKECPDLKESPAVDTPPPTHKPHVEWTPAPQMAYTELPLPTQAELLGTDIQFIAEVPLHTRKTK